MKRRLFMLLALAGSLLLLTVSAVGADHSTTSGPSRAVSYINPDSGAATANSDVNRNSSCESSDREDTQMVSPLGSTANNVHNDACLFTGYWGENYFDGPASFESSGVGVISACPDPDNAGPRMATTTGQRCTQTGYQSKGTAGDREYHARLNSTVAGDQVVTFCYDPELNGCADAQVKRTIVIHWVTQASSGGGGGYSR